MLFCLTDCWDVLRTSNGHYCAGSAEARAQAMSLKVLSAHLGLSIAAISRVPSATRLRVPFPMETQDRILTAAEMLNYQPNLFARSLRDTDRDCVASS
jgi:hypothetical protein